LAVAVVADAGVDNDEQYSDGACWSQDVASVIIALDVEHVWLLVGLLVTVAIGGL